MKFEIQDFALSIVFALLGAVFVSNFFISFLTKLNAVLGVIFSYGLYFVLILILSRLGLVIMSIKLKSPVRFFGMLLITMGLIIIMSWGNIVNLETCALAQEGCNPTNFQSIDGLFYSLYSAIIGVNTALKLNLIKVMTYIITPFVLSFTGGLMTKGAPEVSPI